MKNNSPVKTTDCGSFKWVEPNPKYVRPFWDKVFAKLFPKSWYFYHLKRGNCLYMSEFKMGVFPCRDESREIIFYKREIKIP